MIVRFRTMQQTTYASKRADGLEQPEEREEKKRTDQDAVGEGAVLSATAHGNALRRAHIAGMGSVRHPKNQLFPTYLSLKIEN
jgi:hypothetical protein